MLPAPGCGSEEKNQLFCLTSFYLLFTMYNWAAQCQPHLLFYLIFLVYLTLHSPFVT
jgi:hypothetical protein